MKKRWVEESEREAKIRWWKRREEEKPMEDRKGKQRGGRLEQRGEKERTPKSISLMQLHSLLPSLKVADFSDVNRN